MSEEASDKILRFLIFFIIMVVIIKSLSGAGFFDQKDHKGSGYQVKIPAGWKVLKPPKGYRYPKDVEVVTFTPADTPAGTLDPDIFITIYSKKLTTPIWIEDEFPEILSSIRREGMDIKDKGEIKIDDKISYWLVYHDKAAPALVLEFYMVTDNNIFHKIQYSTPPEDFNTNRKSFEELKDSFKLKFGMF